MLATVVASSPLRALQSLPFPSKLLLSSQPYLSPSPPPPFLVSSSSSSSSSSSTPLTPATLATAAAATPSGPVVKKRKRYRKPYPGESEGIVEEMRFVAMRLRTAPPGGGGGEEEKGEVDSGEESWRPSAEGFVKCLVDSKLVFDTVERIVDESSDVAYVYFRRSGLERSASLAKDLEWFKEQNIVIPEPSSPGITYANYLNELAESSAPSFLCHFYNLYFAHINGGVGIGRKVSEKLFEGREFEFYKWDSDVQLLLKGVREKLNKLGEHWSRDEKNKCLREAAKSFRYSGRIIRLIVL